VQHLKFNVKEKFPPPFRNLSFSESLPIKITIIKSTRKVRKCGRQPSLERRTSCEREAQGETRYKLGENDRVTREAILENHYPAAEKSGGNASGTRDELYGLHTLT
jgi:hypothetical protein